MYETSEIPVYETFATVTSDMRKAFNFYKIKEFYKITNFYFILEK